MLTVATRIFNTPLLAHPGKVEAILWALRDRLGISLAGPTPEASEFFGSARRGDGSSRLTRLYKGVGIISVVGTLVNRGAYVGAYSGAVSYEGLSAQIRDAMDDPEVKSIVLDIDSFGGEAAGMFALAQQIREARTLKPFAAVVNDHALSGGYALASAANEIFTSRTSGVGSIGVVLVHYDHSAALLDEGIKPTIIHAGAHKADGNPYEPLSEEARADFAESVNEMYEIFLETVHLGRGRRLGVEGARATEARVLSGQAAIDAGLADRFGTMADVLEKLAATGAPSARRLFSGGKNLSTKMEGKPTLADLDAESLAVLELAQQGVEAALPQARAEASAEGEATGKVAGAKTERVRIASILSSEEATGREEQATALALDTDLSAEDAVALLKKTPRVAKVPPLAERVEDSPLTGAAASAAKVENVDRWAAAYAKRRK